MIKNGFRRFFLRCLLVLALVFAVKLSLDSALGWILAEVFARGTKCEVSLSNPEIHFFPLRASVENVMIRHRSEPADAGFRARRISINLDVLRLFRKELLLSELILEGAHAKSEGTDTGFIQTFAFLFPPKDPNEKPAPPSGFTKWAKSWIFHITTIRIVTADRPDQLTIGFLGQEYRWDAVDVRFIEQDSDASKPYDISATATNFRLIAGGRQNIPLGSVSAKGEIGFGRLVIADARLEAPAESNGEKSISTATGKITLGGAGQYAIDYRLDLRDYSLQPALGGVLPRKQDIPRRLTAAGSLLGEYMHPRAIGKAEVNFPPGAIVPGRPECGIAEVQLSYDVSPEIVRLTDIAAEDILANGSATLRLDSSQALAGTFELTLDKTKRWMQSCFLMSSEEPTLHTAISQSLADSRTAINVNGTLAPLDVTIESYSDLSLKDRNIQTQLDGRARVTDMAIEASFSERGVIPQIQRRRSVDPEGSATGFRLAVNSNLDIELHFDRVKEILRIAKFHILRYPTDRLLSRIGPFLSEKTFRILAAMPAENSLLDLDFEGALGLSTDATLKGQLVMTELAPASIHIDRLVVPVALQRNQLQLNGVRAETHGGTVTSDLQFDFGSQEIEANITLSNVQPGKDERWQNALPFVQSVVSGEARVEGSLPQLQYSGNIRVETVRSDEPGRKRLSDLKVGGDSKLCKIEAIILDGAAQLQAQLPLRAEPAAPFHVNVQAANFPIGYFMSPQADLAESTPEGVEQRTPAGTLSGTLRYQGPYGDPLAGQGEFRVTQLSFDTGGLSIEDSGTLHASLDSGKLLFTNIRFRAAGKELVLSGGVDRISGWNAALQGEWELGSFVPPGDYLEQVSGTLGMSLSIRGPVSGPEISGPLTLKQGSVSFPLGQTIVGVSKVEVDARFDQGNLNIQKLDARSGGARITGTGGVKNILDGSARSINTRFDFEDLVVEPVEHLTLDLDGHLSVFAEASAVPTLGGEVTMKSGQYENIVKLRQVLAAITNAITGSSETAARARRGPSSGSDLLFDVRFRAPGGFLLDTNIAQAELRSELHLTGSAEVPLLQGTIEAIEGTFGLQSQNFEIVSGEANFFPSGTSLDPRLSILGEASAASRTGEEHTIRIAVTGTVTRPEVSFSSDSGLRREEIQAMLGLGANIEALDFLRGGRKTKTFTELINPRSDVSIEERLTGLTKFETVQIDTSLSPTTGEFVPKLVAKRPFARRTELEIESELTSRQTSSADIEYSLTPYLSLIAGWRSSPLTNDTESSSGTFGAGIHYRTTFPGFQLFSPRLSKEVWGKSR